MGVVVYGTGHYRSILGVLKIVELLFGTLALILVAVPAGTNDLIKAFYAGTIIGIILTLVVFVLSSTEAGHSINGALKFQCYCWAVLFVYLTIVSAILVSRKYSRTYQAGGVFGLFDALVYLIDALFSFNAYGNRLCF